MAESMNYQASWPFLCMHSRALQLLQPVKPVRPPQKKFAALSTVAESFVFMYMKGFFTGRFKTFMAASFLLRDVDARAGGTHLRGAGHRSSFWADPVLLPLVAHVRFQQNKNLEDGGQGGGGGSVCAPKICPARTKMCTRRPLIDRSSRRYLWWLDGADARHAGMKRGTTPSR